MLILDKGGLWETGVLKMLGSDPFTHHFLATFFVINAVFFSVGTFLTSFDMRNFNSIEKQKGVNNYVHWIVGVYIYIYILL